MAKAKPSKDISNKSLKPAKPLAARKRNQTEKGKALKNAVKKAAKKNKTTDELNSDDDAEDSDSSGSEKDELEAEDTNSGTMHVDWSDVALSEALIARIMENRDIKRALYPPPGPNASTAKGGGKTKVAAQWQLCLNLLGEIPKYKEALASVVTAKQKGAYANKIKNRLRTMAKITREHMDEMGQTGAGIRSADEIDTSVTNAFTTKWQEISASCPWFFDMRDLIAQRPNLIPTGLGHSDTVFDLDVLNGASAPSDAAVDAGEQLATAYEDDVSSGMDIDGRALSQINDGTQSSESEFPPANMLSELAGSGLDRHPSPDWTFNVDDDETEKLDNVKPKEKPGKVNGRKTTAAKSGTSNPAPPPAPTPAATSSKKTKMTEFAEIAKSEELTRHKELEVAAIRARQSLKVLDVKSRLAEQREERKREERQAKRAERMEKLKMKQMKLQHAHELHMARIATSAGIGSSHAGSFYLGGGSASSTSHVPPHSYPTSQPDYGSEFGGSSTGAGTSFVAPVEEFGATSADLQYTTPRQPSYNPGP